MSNLLLLAGLAALAFCLVAPFRATIMLGGGVTDIRGSMGGTTFSRCAGGNYIRNRTTPVNPRSPLQSERRAAVAYVTKFWSDQLNDQQRTDWRAYASATTWTNRLGQTIEINGLAAFLRVNALQRLIPSTLISEAPTAVGHAGGVSFTFAAESDTSKIQLAEPTGSFDMDTDIHTLWLFQGIPAEPGRIATPKGFKYIGRAWGSSGTPLSFPLEFDSAYTMRADQFVTVKATFQDEHYRISGPHWATDTAAAA